MMNMQTVTRLLIAALMLPLIMHAVSIDEAYVQLGDAFKEQSNIQEALDQYKKAFAYNDANVDACYNIGAFYYEHGNTPAAIPYFEKCLALQPSHYRAALYLGASYAVCNALEKAIQTYQNAIAIEPQEPRAHYCLGIALQKAKRITEAVAAFEKTVSLSPGSYDAHVQLAHCLRQTYDYARALNLYNKALSVKPDDRTVIFEKANTLTMQGDTQTAIPLYEQLIAHDPHNMQYAQNYAFALRKHGSIDQALNLYQALSKLSPHNSIVHIACAHTYLSIGNFERGFLSLAASETEPLPGLVTDSNTVNGKNVLITTPWQLEDMIQFMRYALLLKKKGATIIMQNKPEIESLLKHCPFIDHILYPGTPPPCSIHAYIPLLSIPALFQLNQVGTNEPYLHCPAPIMNQWRAKLAHDSRIKIGIYWRSMEPIINELENSTIPLDALKALAQISNAQLYALQSITADELHLINTTIPLCTLTIGDNTDDPTITQLCGALENMDIVITRDSFVAHLAGALGRRTFVLIPPRADWRWILGSKESPWYPCVTVVQRDAHQNWHDVINTLLTTYTLSP